MKFKGFRHNGTFININGRNLTKEIITEYFPQTAEYTINNSQEIYETNVAEIS